jgi:hypothetical protein
MVHAGGEARPTFSEMLLLEEKARFFKLPYKL